MFHNNTLLVVGAGSSVDAGLPLGTDLVKHIATMLRFKQTTFGIGSGSGNQEIYDIILSHFGHSKAHKVIQRCVEMSHSLQHADSIDAYLNDFRDDEDLVFCGKVSIAKAISEAETNRTLTADRSNVFNSLNWVGLEVTWFSKFFGILKSGVRLENIETIFDNISIVCFNYDRCIEQYLFYAMRNYYGISAREAFALLRKLKIYHPYGTIGAFDFDPNTGHSNYGLGLRGAELIERSKTIRTVYENKKDIAGKKELQLMVSNAEQVLFLGFGFHPLNIELMRSNNNRQNLKIYATGWKIPAPALDLITKQISSVFHEDEQRRQGLFQMGIILRSDLLSNQLLHEFGTVFSSN